MIIASLICLFIVTTHSLLGRALVQHNAVFAGLAVPQAAVFGILFSEMMGWSNPAPKIVGVTFALATAFVFALLIKRDKEKAHVWGGVLALATLLATVLLLNNLNQTFVQHVMLGQLEAVGYRELVVVAAISCMILVCAIGWGEHIQFLMHVMLAVAVTSSVQTLGLYTVFAILVLPALVSASLNERSAIILSIVIGWVGLIGGYWVALELGRATGPFMVGGVLLASMGALLGPQFNNMFGTVEESDSGRTEPVVEVIRDAGEEADDKGSKDSTGQEPSLGDLANIKPSKDNLDPSVSTNT